MRLTISFVNLLIVSLLIGVGVTGFEPATTWSQTRCATGLRYAPKSNAKLAIYYKIYKLIICRFQQRSQLAELTCRSITAIRLSGVKNYGNRPKTIVRFSACSQ